MEKFNRVIGPIASLSVGLFGIYAIVLYFQIEVVNWTFIIGFPFVSGGIIIHFRPAGRFRGLLGIILWLLIIATISIALSLITGLEGMICVAMAMVPIFSATMLGGFVYLLILRWRGDAVGAKNVMVLPVILLALFDLPEHQPRIYEISDTVMINAPTDVVFNMLQTIPDISADEITTRPSHLLGIPKPTEAIWVETPAGAVRHSHWGDDVHFLEHITQVQENKLIAWEFEFPDGWAANGVEDPHVEVGGEYFNVLSGEYVLEDVQGATRLTLTTRTYDNSGFGVYARFWHEFFFNDFHTTILEVIKNRAEA